MSVSYRPARHAAIFMPVSVPSFGLPASVWFIIACYGAIMLAGALTMPFPTRVDELPHLSVIRAQFEHPTLFPDWSQYHVLREDDLTRWSSNANYINHPSLYYLLLAPLMLVTGDPLLFRIANVLIATIALLIGVVAVHRRFGCDNLSPALFALIAASFPKAMIVGGMINNDNLSALAAAALFGGLLGLPGAGWWVLAGLAIAGWTKLTAFLALAAVSGLWLAWQWTRGRMGWTDRLVAFAIIGLLIGAIPYLVTLARTGHVLWVNDMIWRVPSAARETLDLPAFTIRFFRTMIWKWPAMEGIYPLSLAFAGLLAPLLLMAVAVRYEAVRHFVIAYAGATIFLLAVHFVFGWRSYQQMGDLTIMQARYYNILWPGIALAAAFVIDRWRRRWPLLAWIAVGLCLLPTWLGGMIYMLI